jgi:hypothetical protein
MKFVLSLVFVCLLSGCVSSRNPAPQAEFTGRPVRELSELTGVYANKASEENGPSLARLILGQRGRNEEINHLRVVPAGDHRLAVELFDAAGNILAVEEIRLQVPSQPRTAFLPDQRSGLPESMPREGSFTPSRPTGSLAAGTNLYLTTNGDVVYKLNGRQAGAVLVQLPGGSQGQTYTFARLR